MVQQMPTRPQRFLQNSYRLLATASGGVNSEEQQQHWFPLPDDSSGQSHLRSLVSAPVSAPGHGLPVSAGEGHAGAAEDGAAPLLG